MVSIFQEEPLREGITLLRLNCSSWVREATASRTWLELYHRYYSLNWCAASAKIDPPAAKARHCWLPIWFITQYLVSNGDHLKNSRYAAFLGAFTWKMEWKVHPPKICTLTLSIHIWFDIVHGTSLVAKIWRAFGTLFTFGSGELLSGRITEKENKSGKVQSWFKGRKRLQRGVARTFVLPESSQY